MQLTSWEQHSFDSNLGTIWSHQGAVPFHAIVLINNSPQDVIQTRIQQYSFLKNTAILTCFSCPAALLLFSEKQQPRRQALWPLCSVQLSWLNPQGSLYLAIDSLSLKFGPVCVCVWQSIYSYQVFHLNFSASVFHWRIYDFVAFLDSASLLLFLLIRISEKTPKTHLETKLNFCKLSMWKPPSSSQERRSTTSALFNFLSHKLTSGL